MPNNTPQISDSSGKSRPASPAQHIIFLDGMRGAAALYVVLFHLATVLPRQELPFWAYAATEPFTQGHIAVGIFIVLSGYLLMLPATRSDTFALRGGLKTFFARRGRRILPPYYAALLLSIPPEWFKLHFHGETISIGSVVSHLFMVHNLRSDWVTTINGPLWSVAVECQIYIIFALLLLPLCRRFGFGTSVLCAQCFMRVDFGAFTHFAASARQQLWLVVPLVLGIICVRHDGSDGHTAR